MDIYILVHGKIWIQQDGIIEYNWEKKAELWNKQHFAKNRYYIACLKIAAHVLIA